MKPITLFHFHSLFDVGGLVFWYSWAFSYWLHDSWSVEHSFNFLLVIYFWWWLSLLSHLFSVMSIGALHMTLRFLMCLFLFFSNYFLEWLLLNMLRFFFSFLFRLNLLRLLLWLFLGSFKCILGILGPWLLGLFFTVFVTFLITLLLLWSGYFSTVCPRSHSQWRASKHGAWLPSVVDLFRDSDCFDCCVHLEAPVWKCATPTLCMELFSFDIYMLSSLSFSKLLWVCLSSAPLSALLHPFKISDAHLLLAFTDSTVGVSVGFVLR